jgi:hypothetical protein
MSGASETIYSVSPNKPKISRFHILPERAIFLPDVSGLGAAFAKLVSSECRTGSEALPLGLGYGTIPSR